MTNPQSNPIKIKDQLATATQHLENYLEPLAKRSSNFGFILPFTNHCSPTTKKRNSGA